MNDEVEDMKNRLRASELLGKSQADFIEKVEHSGTLGWLLAIPGVLLLSWVVGMIENA